MEDVLLPKSFSCSTASSEEEQDENAPPPPHADAVSVAVAMPPPKPACKYTAKWAATLLTFLVLAVCIAMVLWYIIDS